MKKSIGTSMCKQNNEEKDVVEYCKNCFGLKPCWCGNPEYIKTWYFVYYIFKKCKM